MKTAIQRCFSRASAQYDNHAFFQKKVADQLMGFLREVFIPIEFQGAGSMPNSFAFQEKFSEARHSKVSMGSRRRFFLEQKWKAEASALDSGGYIFPSTLPSSTREEVILERYPTTDEMKSKDYSTIILDVGCGTGYSFPALSNLFPASKAFGVDLSFSQCQRASDKYSVACADFDHLPFPNGSVDVIFSNLALQWSLDLNQTVKHLAEVLAPGGALVFSTLGEGTLQELTQAKRQSRPTLPENLLSHPFLPLSETLLALEGASFKIMIKKRETETFWFNHPLEVLRSLKAVGANYLSSGNIGLSTKKSIEALIESYPLDAKKKRYPLTYQVDYIVAKKER